MLYHDYDKRQKQTNSRPKLIQLPAVNLFNRNIFLGKQLTEIS